MTELFIVFRRFRSLILYPSIIVFLYHLEVSNYEKIDIHFRIF